MKLLLLAALVAAAAANELTEKVTFKCSKNGQFCASDAGCCKGKSRCLTDAQPDSRGRVQKRCRAEWAWATKTCNQDQPCDPKQNEVCYTHACDMGECYHGAADTVDGVCVKPFFRWRVCKMAPVNLVVLADFSSSISSSHKVKQYNFLRSLVAGVQRQTKSQSDVSVFAFGTKVTRVEEGMAIGDIGNVGQLTNLFAAFSAATAELVSKCQAQPKRRCLLLWASDLDATTGKHMKEAAIGAGVKKVLKPVNGEIFGLQTARGSFLGTATKEAYNKWYKNCANADAAKKLFSGWHYESALRNKDSCPSLMRRFRYEHSKQALAAKDFLSSNVKSDCEEDVCACKDGKAYDDHLLLIDIDKSAHVVEDLLHRLCITGTVYAPVKHRVALPKPPAEPKCPKSADDFKTMADDELTPARTEMVEALRKANDARTCKAISDISFVELAAGWGNQYEHEWRAPALGNHFAGGWVDNDMALRLGFALGHAGVCVEDDHDKLCKLNHLKQLSDCTLGYKGDFRLTADGSRSKGKKKESISTLWSTRFTLAALMNRYDGTAWEGFHISSSTDDVSADEKKATLAKAATELAGLVTVDESHWSIVDSRDEIDAAIGGRTGILIADNCGITFDPRLGATGHIGLFAVDGTLETEATNQDQCRRYWFFPVQCAKEGFFFEEDSLFDASLF